MNFDFARFKFMKRVERIREDYGENANLALRNVKYEKEKPAKHVHSFSELIGKTFSVPQVKWTFVENARVVNPFHITEKDKVKLALNRASKEKTIFD